MIPTRLWLVGGLALVLVVSGGMVVRARHDGACAARDVVVDGSQVPTTLLTPHQLSGRPDAQLARLVSTAEGWPAPFGPVLGATGFDHGRPVTLAGLPTGLGVWTRTDPVFGILGPALRPRWGIRDSQDAHAWDARGSRFLGIALPGSGPPEFSAYDARTGRRLWCARVGAPIDRDDALVTAMSADGGVVALTGKPGHLRLTSLDPAGQTTWSHRVGDVDEGDYLGSTPFGFVAGGRPAYELADVAALPARRTVSGFDPRGRVLWSYRSAPGSAPHVLGVDGSTTVLLDRATTTRVLGLDGTGRVVWSVPVPDHADAALRAGTVLVRSGNALTGVAAASGAQLWRTALPRGRQVFPYGFALDQQPMLADHQVLLGETDALVSVDTRTGAERRYRLPTDGLDTTYWPYQVVVGPDLIGVVTNTGAVVLRRQG